MPQTVRDATFELMRKLKLTTLFGNPGSTEEPFLKEFPADMRYILGLQEASVVGMADGYAQQMRRPVLVNLHTAPGLGNAMGNLVTASQNKTPLIITCGQQTRDMLLLEPWLTNTRATQLPEPWVKWSYEPARAVDIPAALMRAFATALQPPAGPVFLSLPLDDWEQPYVGEPAAVRSVSQRVAPDPQRLSHFVERLAAAKKPVLVLGPAVDRSGGWDAAVALAEALGIRVWAAPACERTPFPETHPLYAGALPFAIGPLTEHLQGHDLILVLGAPVFRYYPYVAGDYVPRGAQLLHVTDDPREAARAPVGDSLLGDIQLAMQAMLTALPKAAPRSASAVPREPPAAPPAHKGPLSAAEVYFELHAASPADTVVVDESPSNLADFHRHWPILAPESFFTMASGGLGWGLPAAVGIALAESTKDKSRPVVAIMGDGSLQYSIQALWSAAQQQLPLVVVVLRNGQYGILKSFAVQENTPGVPGLDLPGIDCTALARGYGMDAQRITERADIGPAARAAFAGRKPVLLEVAIASTVPPLLPSS